MFAGELSGFTHFLFVIKSMVRFFRHVGQKKKKKENRQN